MTEKNWQGRYLPELNASPSELPMIILLSPAKSLDFESPVSQSLSTVPEFLDKAARIMKVLRKQSATDLSSLMNLSEKLAELNFERNRIWTAEHNSENSRPAVFAFQGDVYQGLDAASLTTPHLKRLQKHVRILSGLYGVLRPMDIVQPYRLEMGTRLKNVAGANLYDFWGDTISETIQQELSESRSRLLVNLASNEYSKAARLKQLDATVLTPSFKDWKNGQYKMISFFAKKARGMMARYLIANSVKSTKKLQDFDVDGYRFNDKLSSDLNPVFTRRMDA